LNQWKEKWAVQKVQNLAACRVPFLKIQSEKSEGVRLSIKERKLKLHYNEQRIQTSEVVVPSGEQR